MSHPPNSADCSGPHDPGLRWQFTLAFDRIENRKAVTLRTREPLAEARITVAVS